MERRRSAGTCTLCFVPAPDGGTLTVRRQTGQAGTASDAAQDAGRRALRWGAEARWVPVAGE